MREKTLAKGRLTPDFRAEKREPRNDLNLNVDLSSPVFEVLLSNYGLLIEPL